MGYQRLADVGSYAYHPGRADAQASALLRGESSCRHAKYMLLSVPSYRRQEMKQYC